MGRSYRPGIGARGVIGIVAAVVDECSVSKAVMHKCQLSARKRPVAYIDWITARCRSHLGFGGSDRSLVLTLDTGTLESLRAAMPRDCIRVAQGFSRRMTRVVRRLFSACRR